MSKRHLIFLPFIIFLSLLACAFIKKCPFPELKGCKSTMNFCVWAPAYEDASVIAKGLEDYYRQFLSDLRYGGMLKKKPEIYIFKNYQEYLDKTKPLGYNVSHTGGIAIPRSARKPAKVYSFLSKNLLSEVLPHELTHLLFKEITAGLMTDAKIPLWLNEGIAVYEEKGRRYEAPVKHALETNQIISISEIVNCNDYPLDLNKRALFYAQSASLVDFLLNKYGGAKFLAFSKKLIRGGKDIDEALFSTYYPHIKNVSQLSDAWLNFLKQ
jgi:hypothetical protein